MTRETTTGPTPGPRTAEGVPGTTLTIKGPDGFPVFRSRRETLEDRVNRIWHRLCRAGADSRAAWDPEGYPARGWTWAEATVANVRHDRLSRLYSALLVRVEESGVDAYDVLNAESARRCDIACCGDAESTMRSALARAEGGAK